MGKFNVDSSKKVTIYTGLCDVKVVAINPTKEELNKFGVNIKEEPNYTSKNEDGQDKCRVDFWLHEEKHDIKTKVSFFIENKISIAATSGNMEFINDFGQSTWAKSVEDLQEEKYKWFNNTTARPAIVGETGLISFIKSWLSIGNKEEAKIDEIVALAKGNMSEIKPLIKQFPNKKVQVLLYEKGGYQSVYNRCFGVAGNTKLDYWKNKIEGSNINYQKSFQLKELSIEFAEAQISDEEETSASNPWK